MRSRPRLSLGPDHSRAGRRVQGKSGSSDVVSWIRRDTVLGRRGPSASVEPPRITVLARRDCQSWGAKLCAILGRIGGVEAVTIGGSRAAGTAGERSDWDVDVYY